MPFTQTSTEPLGKIGRLVTFFIWFPAISCVTHSQWKKWRRLVSACPKAGKNQWRQNGMPGLSFSPTSKGTSAVWWMSTSPELWASSRGPRDGAPWARVTMWSSGMVSVKREGTLCGTPYSRLPVCPVKANHTAYWETPDRHLGQNGECLVKGAHFSHCFLDCVFQSEFSSLHRLRAPPLSTLTSLSAVLLLLLAWGQEHQRIHNKIKDDPASCQPVVDALASKGKARGRPMRSLATSLSHPSQDQGCPLLKRAMSQCAMKMLVRGSHGHGAGAMVCLSQTWGTLPSWVPSSIKIAIDNFICIKMDLIQTMCNFLFIRGVSVPQSFGFKIRISGLLKVFLDSRHCGSCVWWS